VSAPEPTFGEWMESLPTTPSERREPLFEDYWTDLAGNRIRRSTKRELAEATRLWVKHEDIRRGETW
jgi:hypothetical protein